MQQKGDLTKKLGETAGTPQIDRDLAYSLMRIYVGIALFIRGWIFLSDPSAITQLSGAQTVYWWYAYIIGAHLIGGLLMALGILTRSAALIQMPILIGAIVFIHFDKGLMTVGQSLELAVLVLALLIVFALFGSGRFAVGSLMTRRIAPLRLRQSS